MNFSSMNSKGERVRRMEREMNAEAVGWTRGDAWWLLLSIADRRSRKHVRLRR